MPDFIVNKAGGKVYKDVKKHEVMEIPSLVSDKDKGVVHHVLSVGIVGLQREPIVTVKEPDQKITVYRLPKELLEWVEYSMGMSAQGFKAFPTDIEFGTLNGRTYAEML